MNILARSAGFPEGKARCNPVEARCNPVKARCDWVKASWISSPSKMQSSQSKMSSSQSKIEIVSFNCKLCSLNGFFLGENTGKKEKKTGESGDRTYVGSTYSWPAQPPRCYLLQSLGRFKRIGFVVSFKAAVWTDMVDREIKIGRKIRKQREGKTARKRHGRGVREEERGLTDARDLRERQLKKR